LPGFDITTDGLQTKYSQQSAGPTSSDSGNNLRDVRKGNNPISQAIGLEFEFDLGEGWKISEKVEFRLIKELVAFLQLEPQIALV
jgi:hypothetical protein